MKVIITCKNVKAEDRLKGNHTEKIQQIGEIFL